LNFDYYFVVGKKVDNAQSKKNPNNPDLILDKAAFRLSCVRSSTPSQSARPTLATMC